MEEIEVRRLAFKRGIVYAVALMTRQVTPEQLTHDYTEWCGTEGSKEPFIPWLSKRLAKQIRAIT